MNSGTEPTQDDLSGDAEVDAAIAEYYRRVDAGTVVDVELFISEFGHLAQPLREFFDAEEIISAGNCNGAIAPHAKATVQQLDSTIEQYKLLQPIGEGGFGVVYMANQLHPVKRKVALKVIKPGMDSNAVIARFEAERQALAMMDHPHIAKVLDGGSTVEGHPYFVMELVKGVAITSYCDDNKLTIQERIRLFISVCEAVQHAHQKGIIHRDLKPSNVMVTLHDGRPVVKVIDFGVAKAMHSQLTEKTLYTAYGQMIGTPQYMSPEQAEISGLDVDTRSDIYSLGVLLYELLTGSTPLDPETLREAGFVDVQKLVKEVYAPKPSARLGTSTLERVSHIADQRRITPENLRKQLTGDLEWVVMKTLEKERDRRYATTLELSDELNRYLENIPVQAQPPSLRYRFQKYFARNRLLVTSAAIIACVLVFASLTSSIFAFQWHKAWRAESQQRGQAESQRRTAERLREDESKAREEAEKLQKLADEKTAATRRNLYAADINAISHLITEGNLGAARDLLETQLPDQGNEDLRGWEWEYYRELASGDQWFRLDGHTSTVRDVFFSTRHGNRFLVSWSEKEAILWDLAKRAPMHTWTHNAGIESVGFSHDGGLVGVLNGSGKLSCFDAESFIELSACGESSVLGFRFHPKKDFAVLTTENGIFGWDCRGAQTRKLIDQIGLKRQVSWASDGNRFCAITPTGVLVYNMDDGEVERRIDEVTSYVGRYHSCLFLPNHEGLVLSSFQGTKVHRFGRHGWTEIMENDGINRIVSTPSGTRMATSSFNHWVGLWELPDFRLHRKLYGHSDEVFCVDISHDGQLLASGGQDKAILIWKTDAKTQKGVLTNNANSYAYYPEIAFSTNGSWAAIPTYDQKSIVFDLASFEPVLEFKGIPLYSIGSTQIVADPEGTPDSPNPTIGRRRVYWDVENGSKVKELLRRKGTVIAETGTARVAVVAYADGTMEVIDQQLNATISSWQHGMRPMAQPIFPALRISPNEQVLFSAADKNQPGTVSARSLASGELIWQYRNHSREVTCIACSPDGKLVASASYDGTCCIWNALSGQLVHLLIGHKRGVTNCSFSEDGKTLATSSHDYSTRLWHVRTGRPLSTLSSDVLSCVGFAPAGNSLLSINFFDGDGGVLHKWQVGPTVHQ